MATSRSSLQTISDNKTTVQSFCKTYSCSVQSLINANAHNFTVYNLADCIEYDDYKRNPNTGRTYSPLTKLFIKGTVTPTTLVKDYINTCNRNNTSLVQGLILVLPSVSNGGVTETTSYYLSNTGIPKLLTNSYKKEIKIAKDADVFKGSEKTTYGSYFQRVAPNGEQQAKAGLPVIPQEFSDSNSVSWNSVSLMGRSVDYQIYTGSAREVSFTLQLHQELYSDTAVENGSGTRNIYNLVKLIESSCYPYYTDVWAGPPQVIFKIGNHLYIKGVLTSCSVTWKLPIDKDGYYNNCDISVSVRETNGPYGARDIANGSGGGEGSYRNKVVVGTELKADDVDLGGQRYEYTLSAEAQQTLSNPERDHGYTK